MGVGAERAGPRRSGCRGSRALLAFGVFALAALVGPAGAAGLIGTAAPAAAAEGPEPLIVRILANGIEPPMVQVAPGATVVWVNLAEGSRSILADDASFDSGALAEGERFQFAFTEPRTVSYSVVQAPGISGTVVVQDPTAPVPAPAPGTPGTAPSGFAYTGSSTAVNGAVGGLILALGAVLLYAAQRRGLVATISGLTFFAAPDDLLPSRRHRRRRRAETRRGWIRR